jgi:hypothetical protein
LEQAVIGFIFLITCYVIFKHNENKKERYYRKLR